MRFSHSFPPEAVCVREVRTFVRASLRPHVAGEVVDDVTLLASELAANVVEHACTDYEVTIELRPSEVHVELVDGSAVLPALRDLADSAEDGRGLHILAAVAGGWGISQGPGGKTLWFDVPRGG